MTSTVQFCGALVVVLFACLSVQQADGIKISAWASCNADQIRMCSQAALNNKLNKLEGGGSCSEDQYVHFTHLCTVSDYRPNVDYCCCAFKRKAMCCRYHHTWDRFRCTESEDTVDVLSHRGLPLEILLPAILGPIGVILVCVYCWIRCHCNGEDEDEKPRKYCGWCYKGSSDKGDQISECSSSGLGRGQPITFQNSRPDSDLHSSISDTGCKVPLTPEGERLIPTAPPGEPIENRYVFPFSPSVTGILGTETVPNLPVYSTHPRNSYSSQHSSSGGSVGGLSRQNSVFGSDEKVSKKNSDSHHHHAPHLYVHQNSTGSRGGRISPRGAAVGPHPVYNRQLSALSCASNFHGVPYTAGHRVTCPSCSSAGPCAPPAYEESFRHPVMCEGHRI